MEKTDELKSHPHPNYVGVFIVLAVLTAIEVGVTYLPFMSIPNVRVAVLVPLAILKAVLVALYYMHLKFDRKIFSILFGMGVLMALALIVSLIVIFGPPLTDFRL
jgi:cytochrome c oxidase subunit 4